MGRAMFSHVHVGVADFALSFGFYSAVLGALKLEVRAYRPEQSWAAWGAQGSERPLFFIASRSIGSLPRRATDT